MSLLLCALTLASCAASPSALSAATSPAAPGMETPAAGAEIALIATEQRMASAFGQDIWAAVSGFAGAAGLTCAPYKAEAGDAAAARSTLDLAVTGGARVVVAMDAAVSRLLLGEAAAYGSVYFILFDLPGAQSVGAETPNVTALGFHSGDEGWLAGYAAACVSVGSTTAPAPPPDLAVEEPPSVAVWLPVYAAEAYVPRESGEPAPAPPATRAASASRTTMRLTIEHSEQVLMYLDSETALHTLAALYGMEAAAAALGVDGENARIRLIPVLMDAPEDAGGLPAEIGADIITSYADAYETITGHYGIATPMMLGVGELQAEVDRAARGNLRAWCVEMGDDPVFGEEGGFAPSAAAGVLRACGGELYRLLEGWLALNGRIPEGGVHRVGAAEGALSLVLNEGLYTAEDAPWRASYAARELLRSAAEDYTGGGHHLYMRGGLAASAREPEAPAPQELPFEHITVEGWTHFNLWEPDEG